MTFALTMVHVPMLMVHVTVHAHFVYLLRHLKALIIYLFHWNCVYMFFFDLIFVVVSIQSSQKMVTIPVFFL